MAKHRLFFMINLIGLAIGLTAVVMIVAYVQDQNAHDRWVPDGRQIYRIGYFAPRETGAPFVSKKAPGILAPSLNEIFGEKLTASRHLNTTERYQVGETYFDTETLRTEPSYFDVFNIENIEGNARTAIEDPNNLILTESMALKYFGRRDVLGKTIGLAGKRDMKVGAVIADWPIQSHTRPDQFRKLVPSELQGQDWMFNSWTSASMWTYVKLDPSYSHLAFDADLQALFQSRLEQPDTGQPLALPSTALFDIYTGGREALLTALLVVAGFILVIASINFVNLTLSRLILREKEVAIRRVVGASKGQVVLQFLFESCFTTLLALSLGLALAELILPAFNTTMGTDIALNLGDNTPLLLFSLCLVFGVGLGAGAIPAFAMARGLPADGLANNCSETGSIYRRFGAGLVLVQFSLAIGLIAATYVVYSQTFFALTQDRGYSTENKTAVYVGAESYNTFETRFKRIPGVTSTVGSFSLPGRGGEISSTITLSNGEAVREILHYATTPEFLRAYQVSPLAGRLLSDDRTTDAFSDDLPEGTDRAPQAVVINDQARLAMGFETPDAAVGQLISTDLMDNPIPLQIVGVIPSIKLRSVRHRARAILFADIPPLNQFVTLSYTGRSAEEIMADIKTIWDETAPNRVLFTVPVDQILAQFYQEDQRQATLFAVFSGLAMVIACLGLYGLSGFNAERRTKEIGIRKVLGARIVDIVRLFVWQFSKPVLLANLIAWPLAWIFLQDWLSQFVDRINLTPFPFLAAGIACLVIASVTVASQAIKVARANPVRALKYD